MPKFMCNTCSMHCLLSVVSGAPSHCTRSAQEDPDWCEVIRPVDDIFKHPNCPDWAVYAATQPDGSIQVFRNRPTFQESTNTYHPTIGDTVYIRGVLAEHEDTPCFYSREAPAFTSEAEDRSLRPGWARYVAVDSDRCARYHKDKPVWCADTGQWASNKSSLASHDDYQGGEDTLICLGGVDPEINDWVIHNGNYKQVVSVHDNICTLGRYTVDGEFILNALDIDQFHSECREVKFAPVSEQHAHKLVGKVVRDNQLNAMLITEYVNVQKKVYMDMHAVGLNEVTRFWLGDKPVGAVNTDI